MWVSHQWVCVCVFFFFFFLYWWIYRILYPCRTMKWCLCSYSLKRNTRVISVTLTSTKGPPLFGNAETKVYNRPLNQHLMIWCMAPYGSVPSNEYYGTWQMMLLPWLCLVSCTRQCWLVTMNQSNLREVVDYLSITNQINSITAS